MIWFSTNNLPYEKVGKNEPVCIADEVPFEIPDSWEWVRLGTVFNIEMGQSPAGNTVSSNKDGIEFHQGKVHFGEIFLQESGQYTSDPKKYAEQNSVLLCVRAPVGKVNITRRKICIGRGLCAILPFADMPLMFLYYLLEAYENIFVKQATGTTFIAITAETVKNQLIPLPPLEEQKRIADKISELYVPLKKYGDVESETRMLNSKFPEQLKKSILQWAVQGKLVPQDPTDEPAEALLERIREEKQRLIREGKIKKDKHESVIFRRDNSHYEKVGSEETCIDNELPFDIPDTWSWVRFADIAIFENGDRSNKYPVEADYVSDGIPFFGAKDMGDKYMEFSTVRFITQEKFAQLGNGKLQNGDLVCLLRGSVGKTRIFKESEKYSTGFICAQMMIIRCLDLNILDYLYALINSPYYCKAIESKITGTAVRQLPAREVANILIPLPPLNEQFRIIEKLSEILFELRTL